MAGPPYITGALYPMDNVVPPYQQPNGPGTTVIPQQPIGEKMGLFNAGCGHFFNSWLVQRGSFLDPSDGLVKSVALVTCPLCGYLQQQIIPYSLIDFDPNFMYIIG